MMTDYRHRSTSGPSSMTSPPGREQIAISRCDDRGLTPSGLGQDDESPPPGADLPVDFTNAWSGMDMADGWSKGHLACPG
jgi:hypothetical protein